MNVTAGVKLCLLKLVGHLSGHGRLNHFNSLSNEL